MRPLRMRRAAEEYLEKADYPIVLKADGLGAGEGRADL